MTPARSLDPSGAHGTTPPKSGGNRSERRFLVNQPAYVSGASSPERTCTARICDISRRGMQLILEEPATLEPDVRIEWNGREIRGVVRYQQQRDEDYRVGVQLSDSWDSLVSDVLAQQAEELAAALEAATKASEIKSRFLASVSHEFRTPLNGIIGFSELLYDGVVGPVTTEQTDCLADILSCSHHLMTLINQVLDLTKIESGKMDFEYEEVQLERVAREGMEGVKSIAAGKRIVMRLESDNRVGPVLADAARLRQVLFNYLSNALKHTPEGGRVMVRVACEDESLYRVEVEDTGVGIRLEDRPLLFTEFGQLGAAEKAKSGTGLGLAITSRIVEAQGGRVGVESTFGVGSRFWALLPRRPASEPQP